MIQAQELVHPFMALPLLPLDSTFAWETIISMEENVEAWRLEVRQGLTSLAAELQSVDDEACRRMPPHVSDVANRVRLALLMALIYLLSWPDWNLPDRYVGGFYLVGHILASNLYPAVEHCSGLTPQELLGNGADAWSERLVNATDVTPEDDIIFEATEKASRVVQILQFYRHSMVYLK